MLLLLLSGGSPPFLGKAVASDGPVYAVMATDVSAVSIATQDVAVTTADAEDE
jgi:hypothetical protein